MVRIFPIHYQYRDDTSTRQTTWVSGDTTMRQLIRKCGISSGRIYIHCLVNDTWVNQVHTEPVVPDGIYKFLGTWKTKKEKALEKEDYQRRKKARERQIERKRNHRAMLG